jgi:hypothetical protein
MTVDFVMQRRAQAQHHGVDENEAAEHTSRPEATLRTHPPSIVGKARPPFRNGCGSRLSLRERPGGPRGATRGALATSRLTARVREGHGQDQRSCPTAAFNHRGVETDSTRQSTRERDERE